MDDHARGGREVRHIREAAAKLPETADAETMLESLASVPGVQPLDLGTFDRRVKAVK